MNEYPDVNSPQPADNTQQGTPPPRTVRVALPQTAPYVTYALIGVTVLFFVLQLLSLFIVGSFANGVDILEVYGALIGSAVRNGEIWRLITPILLHDTAFPFLHILFNMYALYVLGVSLERTFGRERFLLLYLMSGFSGNVISFIISSQSYSFSIGASTAVFGLIGAEGIFLIKNRKVLAGQFGGAIRNVIFVILLNLFVIGSLPFIDNWGHIGGLLGGAMFAWFASPLWAIEGIQPMLHLVDKRSMRDVITGAVLVLLIFGTLTVWGLTR